MKPKYLFISLVVLFLSSEASAQFVDNFEDGSFELPNPSRNPRAQPFTIWSTTSPKTYAMTEANGVLKIDYSKTEGVGSYDRFTMNPPFDVSVRSNPNMQVRLKSSVATKLTLRPTYSLQPPTYEEVHQEILGDNEWHTYTFPLYKFLYEKNNIKTVDFFFDQGLGEATSGNIEIDDVKLGWRMLRVLNPVVTISNGTTVNLSWESNNSDQAGSYIVYRDTEIRFTPSAENYLGEVAEASYIDSNLGEYELFYYKIVAISRAGEISLPSADIRVETFRDFAKPLISIEKVNTSVVKKYEKFELELNLENVGIHNVYDAEDIDVYAEFKSPDGDMILINGFYDDYENADTWKLRFSPNLVGEYSYQVFVKDAGGIGESKKGSFTAVNSEHHGWVKPSTVNPHYFAYDDGTSYYPLGVYSPWRNNMERFETFEEHHTNLFAIWDIDYGGFINGEGIIEEELGVYNQAKLGKIDSLLVILENQNTQMMYAIWPHDVFSASVWSTQWNNNPLSKLTNAVDVYADELAWEYQKKHYRYMIARFAHSRSMGIWELINEMNGTDGWQEGRHADAYDWVEKTDKYFNENDPYRHPTTASFSGGFGEYRAPLYERNDIANLHMYPEQGWQVKYPGDTLRSAMYNYAWAAQRFWNAFDKPAIFGEAGADLAYYERNEAEYHETYHNVIWATLANGLAGIPVWWQFFHLSEEDWDGMSYLSDFIKDIDFANANYHPTNISGEDLDAYAMASSEGAFGWARTYNKADISGSTLSITLPYGNYEVTWFDGWSGENVGAENFSVTSGVFELVVPPLDVARKDLAFSLKKIN